jgi:hypothetical protein
LIFLRIPAIRVGEINAFRVFYNPSIQGIQVLGGECTEAHLLTGTPKALGIFDRQNHASVQVTPFWVSIPVAHKHDELDFLDIHARLPPPSTVDSFGGGSGGGLWKVRVYSDSATGKLESIATLEGVAFNAFDVKDGAGMVRCHGLESVNVAMAGLSQSQMQ